MLNDLICIFIMYMYIYMNNPFLARSISLFWLEQRSLSVGKNFGLAKTLVWSTVSTSPTLSPKRPTEIQPNYILTHCGLVIPYGHRSWSALAQVLLPDSTKPLPGPMLIYHQGVLWYSHESKLSGSTHDINPQMKLENYNLRITVAVLRV